MKNTSLVVLFLVITGVVSAQSERFQHSMIEQDWDPEDGLWVNNFRTEYRYDPRGFLTEELIYQWDTDNQVWEPRNIFCSWGCDGHYRAVFVYDATGNLIERVLLSKREGSDVTFEMEREKWTYGANGFLTIHEFFFDVPDYYGWEIRSEYERSDSGLPVRELSLEWSPEEETWIPSWEMLYSYDSSGNLTGESENQWNTAEMKWLPVSRKRSVYDYDGNCTNWSIYQWSYITGWLPEDSAVFILDENGQVLEEYLYRWNGVVLGWLNFQKRFITYHSSGEVEEEEVIYCDEGTGVCKGISYRVNAYNPDGTLKQTLSHRWDDQQMTWIYRWVTEYTYDTLRQVIIKAEKEWDEGNGLWIDRNMIEFEYDGYGNQTLATSSFFNEGWIFSGREISQWAPLDSIPIPVIDFALMEALIDQGLDTNNDGIISYHEVESVADLDIAGYGITDLTGLEAFTDLDSLMVSDNPLKRCNLAMFPGLLYLDCSGCQLTELRAGDIPGLETLICGRNSLVKLDMTNNLSLKKLDLSDLPDLYEVCVTETPFPPAGLDLIAINSPNLNFTTDCSVQFQDSILYAALLDQGIDRNGDGLISRSEVLTTSQLDLTGYGIEDFSGLEAFTGLQRLILNNGGSGIPDLSLFPQVRYLDCSETLVGNLDLSGHSTLDTLICRGSGLYYLHLAGNPQLTYLDCSGNNLYELDITQNRNLKYLNISNMPDLGNVCVWEIPFPSGGMEIQSQLSYNVKFETECGSIRDSLEDNDFLSQAVEVWENMVYKDLTVTDFDGDWYTLEPEGDNMVRMLVVKCEFIDSLGDINMDIVSADGKVLASADGRTEPETIIFPMNPLEKYYLHVHLDSGQFNTYSLSWSAQLYAPNCSMSVCGPWGPCVECNIFPADRDTVYETDTIHFELFAGDTTSQILTFQNLGPEPYVYYTTVDCPTMDDNHNFALQLDGVDDHLVIQRNASIDLSREITLEAWIWIDDTNEGTFPIISRALNGYGYEFYGAQTETGYAIGFMADGGWDRTEAVLLPQKWYHVAASYDAKRIRLYIDGMKVSEKYAPGSITVVNQNVIVGANSLMNPVPKFFTGKMDEIRIWNSSRSSVEIQSFHHQQLSGNEKGLAGYFTLNDLHETIVLDLTGICKAFISGRAIRVPSAAPVERIINLDSGTGLIASGSALSLGVGVNARDLGRGTYHLDLELYSNIEGKPDIRIPVEVHILDAPSISVEPHIIEYGDVDVYETNTIELEIANHGTEVLLLDSLRTSIEGTRITPAVATILPGERRTFRMEAFFRMEGDYFGELILTSNDPSDEELTLPVHARAFGMINNYALLGTIDDTIRTGYQKTHGFWFLNVSSTHGLTMTNYIEYLSIPDLMNDRFFRTDTGKWLSTSLPDSYVVLPPAGSFIFSVTLDATGLREGLYYAQLVMEWYNPFYVKGFLPVRLHVVSAEDPGTGLQPDGGGSSEVTVYPNPTWGLIHIRTPEKDPYIVSVMSITGRLLKKLKVTGEEVTLDLTGFTPGVYLISVQMGNRQITRRVIKY